MNASESIGWWGVVLGIFAGALRGGTPFLLVSLGECLTEKSGKINLGLEGTLLMGAMSAYAVSYHTGNPWLGVMAAFGTGAGLGAIHALLVSRPKVNDVAAGIAMLIFGSGLAFYLGKPYIRPSAPQLPALSLGGWSELPQLEAALKLSPLFVLGAGLALLLSWAFNCTRWGLRVRAVGDAPVAALALGMSVKKVRFVAIVLGSAIAGLGGAHLSLFYPGAWTEAISSGQGLMAVALVIFARWRPVHCLYASMIFGGTQAIAPALQAIGITSGYYLWNAAPYVLTLVVMVITCSPKRTLAGSPGALGTAS
ncbi:MAG: ABC transporter permease [Opitutus sp.]|nr:ABC transporter permease [Opitutus sp.]MCS6247366.1 ABC transporter permease [Opitutus sp.]MCS6274688.1 ABC transporter permease [Opitutus sp.]MCS6276607.1 ABC transporter permease [Opitutus sp.]MCS6301744.1 ABC transporter permease [Opitutus sp.]